MTSTQPRRSEPRPEAGLKITRDFCRWIQLADKPGRPAATAASVPGNTKNDTRRDMRTPPGRRGNQSVTNRLLGDNYHGTRHPTLLAHNLRVPPATIACEKMKFGDEFEPIGYRIEPCQWDEPELDDDDQPTSGTVLVKSATIRLLEPGAPQSSRTPEPKPLPVIRDVQAPRKRNGVRSGAPRGLAAVPSIADAQARKVMTGGIMSVRCDECGSMAGMGCRPAAGSGKAIALSLSPPLAAHESRIIDAAIAGRVDLDAVLSAVG